MKKVLSILLAAVLVFSLSACNKQSSSNGLSSSIAQSSSASGKLEPSPDVLPEPTYSLDLDSILSALTEPEGNEDQEDGAIADNTENQTAGETQLTDGVSPEFKKVMDSYEAFFDEYISFMEEYINSSDAIGMLGDYMSFLSRYAETMDALDKIDTDSLSAADAAYYTEVMARISVKLLKVSG